MSRSFLGKGDERKAIPGGEKPVSHLSVMDFILVSMARSSHTELGGK